MNNILLNFAISRSTNIAVEKFLNKHYSDNNVLIYQKMEACEFNPGVKESNIYDGKEFHKYRYCEREDYKYCPALDEELIKKMSYYEGEIMRQMEQIYPPIPLYNDRQILYFETMKFFDYILEKNHINLFIMSGIPHMVYDFVIYALCKCKGIDTVLMYPSYPVRGYSYFFYDLKNHGINMPASASKRIEDLSDSFRSTLDYYFEKKAERPYSYYSNFSFSQRLRRLPERIKAAKKWNISGKTIIHQFYLEVRRKKKDYYIKKNTRTPDYKKKYIYFGFQYDPECTIMPMGGVFANQQLAIEILSSVVPDDIYIYVKEHPGQGSLGQKDAFFFEKIRKLRNVVLIPTETDPFLLEENCIAVASMTGTMIFESLFYGKPAMIFGNSLYNYRPGGFTVKNKEDCINAVKLIEKGIKITDEDIIEYIKKIELISYHAIFGNLKEEEEARKMGHTMEQNNIEINKMLCDIVDGLKCVRK